VSNLVDIQSCVAVPLARGSSNCDNINWQRDHPGKVVNAQTACQHRGKSPLLGAMQEAGNLLLAQDLDAR
jgi:hypothetical protein